MAITNYERVGKALELLRDGLRPFIERELSAKYGKYWITKVTEDWQHDLDWPEGADMPNMDVAVLLRMMWDQWNEVFATPWALPSAAWSANCARSATSWAHQETFSTDDAYRALDSAARLLAAISAPQADEIEKMKMELLRLRFDEQVRSEKRKSAGTAIETRATASLKPWREVVTPHKDVASGRYQQAEFAADLWQVHLGEGTDEYRNPVEFFRRTYLTESLKGMLVGRGAAAVRSGRRPGRPTADQLWRRQDPLHAGAVPPVLRHLLPPNWPAWMRSCRQAAGRRACRLRGGWCWSATRSPPAIPPSSRTARWSAPCGANWPGSWAAKKPMQRIQADDEKATSPGDALRELFVEYGPCLILIDEWVAYARQLHDQSDLPAGGFETQFTFAQVLTESAKLAKNCLLVISLPASDTTRLAAYPGG